MNRFAYLTANLAIKTVSALSKLNLSVHGKENIPAGSNIFAINHFTRIETLFLPTRIYQITNTPVWSLATSELFKGWMGSFLDQVGAVSNKSPDRDMLIVRTLLSGEADWIIYPEGRMVKNKKIFEKGRYMVSYAGGGRPPHTGAAVLAMRTEFFRQRLRWAVKSFPEEAERLAALFGLSSIREALSTQTYIVPVNITYYPVRARENIIKELAERVTDEIDGQLEEEILTEGTMLLSGVDIDIRFGKPLSVSPSLDMESIRKDIESVRPFGFDDELPSRPLMEKEAQRLTDRAMDAIYSMTTVNPDHIFATILRMMPWRTVDPDDLRRRFYIAAETLIPSSGVHRHRSLTQDPLPVLADDRYHRFSAFWELALQRGTILTEGSFFRKDPEKIETHKIDSVLKWHLSRMETPIAVMANEMEPLILLRKRLRRLALMPRFWIRHRVARYLMKKADRRFEADYQKGYKEGETKPKEIGRPFFLKGRKGKMGVLLVHGYMAAPAEVLELGKHLSSKGFWVYGCRLKGHGTSPDDLAGCTHLDWMASVDEGLAIISTLCRKVALCGFSLGGGLVLDLCVRLGGQTPVVSVSPPIRLVDKKSKFAPALDLWNRLMHKANIGEAQRVFVDNHPEHPHINYAKNPVSGVKELDIIMSRVLDSVENIHSPVLVVQGDHDPVVDEKGTRKAFEEIQSDQKCYLLVHAGKHGILLGAGAAMVHHQISGFLEQLSENEAKAHHGV